MGSVGASLGTHTKSLWVLGTDQNVTHSHSNFSEIAQFSLTTDSRGAAITPQNPLPVAGTAGNNPRRAGKAAVSLRKGSCGWGVPGERCGRRCQVRGSPPERGRRTNRGGRERPGGPRARGAGARLM